VRDALRASAADLFAAAICENGYTSRHLPDDLFNQAVLKCAFVGLRLGRIERVEDRVTPELARMLFAYVTEREHAGRSVGADLWPLIAVHPPPGALERLRDAWRPPPPLTSVACPRWRSRARNDRRARREDL